MKPPPRPPKPTPAGQKKPTLRTSVLLPAAADAEETPLPRSGLIKNKRTAGWELPSGGVCLPFPFLINRTFFIFLAILCFTGILHLQIISLKLLSAELANIAIVGTAEKSSADVIQIITLCHCIFSLC
jgi:hypothetical protein